MPDVPDMPEDTTEEVKQIQSIGELRTFKITLPPKNEFPLTTQDLLRLIRLLFDRVITGTEDSIDINIDTNLFNVTITATLRK